MAEAAGRTLAQALREARARLTVSYIDDPALEARMIVEHFSGASRADAISKPDRLVDAATLAAIDAALQRRLAREPVHRIFGLREFHGLLLSLSAETLEPRPDTETLVDLVLPFARETAARLGACRILDLGTGSGAIALALLKEVPQAVAVGVDISDDALATAARNAADSGLAKRFSTLKSDWFAATEGRYHLIVSNPPYIPFKELETLQPEVRQFDPARALDGGEDGLDAYRIIAAGADAFLEQGARIAVEIGYTQKTEVEDVFRQDGYTMIAAAKDLAGSDRALVFQR
ncbi:MAG: peptide chain release factor N(5)-glutamine methyltransferase [Mesorhizobium sp.]